MNLMFRVAAAIGALLFFGMATPASAQQIVALGASNTAGKGVAPSEAFPAVLEAMLRAKGRNVHVINAGISGDTTSGMLARLDAAVPQGTKVVILQIGGNDLRRGYSPEQRRANVAQIVHRLRARGIRIINAGPLVREAIRAGMELPRGHDMTAEGHHRVAAQLARML